MNKYWINNENDYCLIIVIAKTSRGVAIAQLAKARNSKPHISEYVVWVLIIKRKCAVTAFISRRVHKILFLIDTTSVIQQLDWYASGELHTIWPNRHLEHVV